jgi:hypothetical protein
VRFGWLEDLRSRNWEEIETSGFFAIASVNCGGSTIIKILNQAPLCVPELWGQNFYMSDFNNMGVDLE